VTNAEGPENQFLATIGPGGSEGTDDVIAGNVRAPARGHRLEDLDSLLCRAPETADGQNAFAARGRSNSCLQGFLRSTNGKDRIGQVDLVEFGHFAACRRVPRSHETGAAGREFGEGFRAAPKKVHDGAVVHRALRNGSHGPIHSGPVGCVPGAACHHQPVPQFREGRSECRRRFKERGLVAELPLRRVLITPASSNCDPHSVFLICRGGIRPPCLLDPHNLASLACTYSVMTIRRRLTVAISRSRAVRGVGCMDLLGSALSRHRSLARSQR